MANAAPDDVTPEGREQWFRRVERHLHDASLTSRTWSGEKGISSSTFSDQKKTKRIPSLRLLRAIADSFGYSVVEQIADLASLRVEQIAPPDPFDVAHVSVLDLHTRLETALRTVGNRRPTMTEITRTVFDSSLHDRFAPDGASPYARWRARLFDVPMGWLFPHVGYHGVEFMRWYGTGRGRTEDAYPATSWWRNAPRAYSKERLQQLMSSLWFSDEKPLSFRGSVAEWDAFRHERLEIIARMNSLYPRAELTPYGGYGKTFQALLRHPNADPARHIFTQQASWNRPEPARSRPCADDLVRVVVIVGAPCMRPNPVGSLVGQALGWEVIGFRTLQATLTGVRPIASAGRRQVDESDRTWHRLHDIARRRDDVLVVSTSAEHLLYGSGSGEVALSPAGRDLLNDPTVMTIILRPAEESNTADLWERRAAASSARGTASGVASTTHTDAVGRALERLARELPSAVTLDVQPTYVHWGDAYIDPDETLQFLWHPTIGDLDVRVATEIAHLLVHRTTIAASTAESVRDSLRALDERSVIGMHADRLFDVLANGEHKVGRNWRHDSAVSGWQASAAWDDVFSTPPIPELARRVHQRGSVVTAVVENASPWL